MLNQSIKSSIENLELLQSDHDLLARIEQAIQLVVKALRANKPVLVFGNGGSAADAMHISGELVGKFRFERAALNVICLNTNMTVLTAGSNDARFETVFRRHVEAHAQEGSVLWGLSTSGNSPNVVSAFGLARERGLKSIAMTGSDGGRLRDLTDVLIASPGSDAPSSQNVHVVIYHYMCEEIERLLR
jgi:D-sedoheptulose 7-phosphate isomerase